MQTAQQHCWLSCLAGLATPQGAHPTLHTRRSPSLFTSQTQKGKLCSTQVLSPCGGWRGVFSGGDSAAPSRTDSHLRQLDLPGHSNASYAEDSHTSATPPCAAGNQHRATHVHTPFGCGFLPWVITTRAGKQKRDAAGLEQPQVQPQPHSALLPTRWKRPAHDNRAGIWSPSQDWDMSSITKTTCDKQHHSTFSNRWNNTTISQTWRLTQAGCTGPGPEQREQPPKASLPVTTGAFAKPPKLNAKCVCVHVSQR